MARRSGRGGYQRRSRAEWARLVGEQAAGELSAKAFCAQRGVSYASFCGWRRRLGEQASSRQRRESGFVELALDAAVHATAGWEVELALGEDVVLRLRRR